MLLARAEIAREMLPVQLQMAGWQVDEIVAYRTVKVDVDEASRAAVASADAVLFTSGSTVEGLVDAVGVNGLPSIVGSIGPATSAVADALGVRVTLEADEHTIPGLVDALANHLAGSDAE